MALFFSLRPLRPLMRNPKSGRKGISQSRVPGWETALTAALVAACAKVMSAVMIVVIPSAG